MTWYKCNSDSVVTEYSGDKACPVCKPVVVIDPEDREQVERLLEFFHAAEDSAHPAAYCGSFTCRTDSLREALREFANPKPPKPDEPIGLGAVVEDVVGNRWVRHRPADRPSDGATQWFCDALPGAASYDAIAVFKVLSPGVPVE